MTRLRTLFFIGCLILSGSIAAVVASQDDDMLTSYLTLFSAHAVSDGVKLNWSLERQSPTLTLFRIYRGYEEVGNFSILTEITAGSGVDSVDYSITDHAARPGVSYYYKIAGISQTGESIFPVVISATPGPQTESGQTELPPAALLPGEKITLYVRKPGQITLELRGAQMKTLVHDELRPGIYEFDAPDKPGTRLRVTYNSDFFKETDWPIKQ